MKQRICTLALLALLTLLQGIAPLLHAHVGGQYVQTGAHVHLDSYHARVIGDLPTAKVKPGYFFHASEAPEIGLGLVIERRLLLLANGAQPVLPASPWPLPDLQSVVTLPIVRPMAPATQGKESAQPPPATAPPSFAA